MRSRSTSATTATDFPGRAVPSARISYHCSNGHLTTPSFASEAEVPELWDCPRCGLPAGRGDGVEHVAGHLAAELEGGGYAFAVGAIGFGILVAIVLGIGTFVSSLATTSAPHTW